MRPADEASHEPQSADDGFIDGFKWQGASPPPPPPYNRQIKVFNMILAPLLFFVADCFQF